MMKFVYKNYIQETQLASVSFNYTTNPIDEYEFIWLLTMYIHLAPFPIEVNHTARHIFRDTQFGIPGFCEYKDAMKASGIYFDLIKIINESMILQKNIPLGKERCGMEISCTGFNLIRGYLEVFR